MVCACACVCILLFCTGASRCFLSGATTIFDVGPTELIAVIPLQTAGLPQLHKTFFRLKESFVFDQTGQQAAARAPLTPENFCLYPLTFILQP
jgi:hypothetical protein